MTFPHALWWHAINCLGVAPSLSYDDFVGMSTAPADLAVCAPCCNCRLTHGLRRSAISAIETAGFRAVLLNPPELPDVRLTRKMEAAATRRIPVVWLSGGDAGMVIEAPDQGGIAVVLSCGQSILLADPEPWTERKVPWGSLVEGELYVLKRVREPRGLRSHRTLRSLLEWVAGSFRAPTNGGCITGGPLESHAEGLAAYDKWSGITADETPDRFRERAAVWREARTSGAAYLRGIAGTSRSRFSNLVRRASDLYDAESDLFCEPAACASTTSRLSRRQMRDTVTGAVHLAEDAAHLLAEAALLRAGLSITAMIAIIESPSESLDGIALNEMLYYARAGTRPVRELAARRLAGAESPAAVSALTQLLCNDDGRVAASALWALLQSPAPRLAGSLLSATRSCPRIRSGLDYPFSLSLLSAYRELAPDGGGHLDDLRTSLAAADPANHLITDIDAVLAALHGGKSQIQACYRRECRAKQRKATGYNE